MHGILELLATNSLLLLFAVIGLGYLLGSIRLAGFQLGVVAVLFVGVFFSALDPRLTLPEHIYVIGLVLFVYAVGLQSGPGFFASFRKWGLPLNANLVLRQVGLVFFLSGGSGPAPGSGFCPPCAQAASP